jgi:hypothetical protein
MALLFQLMYTTLRSYPDFATEFGLKKYEVLQLHKSLCLHFSYPFLSH